MGPDQFRNTVKVQKVQSEDAQSFGHSRKWAETVGQVGDPVTQVGKWLLL